ncbi:MAG: hypothetical protein AB7F86_04360 [Bdellovibrionales bacterium]
MRKTLVFCLMIATLSWGAQAKNAQSYMNPTSFRGEILSWQSFSKLPAKKQMQYLKDLRDLLSVMEKNQKSLGLVAANDPALQQLREQIAMFMNAISLLPQANAEDATDAIDENDPGVQPPAPAKPDGMVPVWNEAKKRWECNYKDVAFDSTLGTCAYTRSVRSGFFGRKQTFDFGTGECPDGSTAFYLGSSSRRCVPGDSFDALSSDRRKSLAQGHRLHPNFFDGATSPEATKELVLGGGTHNTDGTRVKPADGSDPTPGPGNGASVDPRGAACVQPKFTCPSMSESARVKKIRDSKLDHCISGGFFVDRKKVRGGATCEKPKASLKYIDNGKEVRLDLSRETDPCLAQSPKGKPERLCNPVLFCLGAVINEDTAKKNKLNWADLKQDLTVKAAFSNDSIQPILLCARYDQNFTASCNTKFEQYTADDYRIGQGPLSKMGNLDVTGSRIAACNPRDNDLTPMMDEWNSIRDGLAKTFKSMCMEKKEFQGLFCKECQVMGDRIYAMNKNATGDSGCPTGEAPSGSQDHPKTTK